jgi:DNA-binding response OmpR family regulator
MTAWKFDDGTGDMRAILIVSRDAEMASVWETLFQQKNYRVIREECLERTPQTAHLTQPALILLDLDLPEDEGISLCRDIRAATGGTLLLLSRQADELDVFRYHFSGVNEILPRSISPMALLIKSMAWLAREEYQVPYSQPVGARF